MPNPLEPVPPEDERTVSDPAGEPPRPSASAIGGRPLVRRRRSGRRSRRARQALLRRAFTVLLVAATFAAVSFVIERVAHRAPVDVTTP